MLVIGWAGLLATIAALATHFILLRAPMTTDLSLWWAPTGLIDIGFVLALGLGGCYLAARDAPAGACRSIQLDGGIGSTGFFPVPARLLLLRRRTWIRMGVPSIPNDSRSLLIRNRS